MYFDRATKVEGWTSKDYEEVNNIITEIDAAALQYDKTKINLTQLCSKPNIDQVDVQLRMFESGRGYFRIYEQVGYLRKANQIHNWLVKNIQDGKDECQSTIFTRDKILKLKHTCHAVMNNILDAPSMLPTQKGFFFGSTDYDVDYVQDIKDTYEICEKILKTTDFEKQVIVYHASW